MRVNFTAKKLNFAVTAEPNGITEPATLLNFECDRVDYSVDVLGLLDALPALGDKIAELATQLDGK